MQGGRRLLHAARRQGGALGNGARARLQGPETAGWTRISPQHSVVHASTNARPGRGRDTEDSGGRGASEEVEKGGPSLTGTLLRKQREPSRRPALREHSLGEAESRTALPPAEAVGEPHTRSVATATAARVGRRQAREVTALPLRFRTALSWSETAPRGPGPSPTCWWCSTGAKSTT